MRLSYKQYKHSICNNGDMLLQSMMVGEQLPIVAWLMASILAKYISLASNDCWYAGTAAELMVNYVQPLFLKAKSAISWEGNPIWREATTRVFSENDWKSMKVNNYTLKSTGAFQIVDWYDSINIIDLKWAFKCKLYPDGSIINFKVRFCARGVKTYSAIVRSVYVKNVVTNEWAYLSTW